MNCQNHPELPATAYCRACGKPVCEQCRRDAFGTVYCEEHVPVPAAAPPPASATAGPPPPPPPGAPFQPVYQQPTPFVSDISPGLAFFLGWIPGVGAIYNGQYAKGLVHAVLWGILVSITSSGAARGMEPVFGILITVWMFYMAFEAYHTARKRRMGEPVDEYSSLLDLSGNKNNVPVAALALIVLGILLLLRTLGILEFDYIVRYWPVSLIVVGIYMLYGRFAGRGSAHEEVRHER